MKLTQPHPLAEIHTARIMAFSAACSCATAAGATMLLGIHASTEAVGWTVLVGMFVLMACDAARPNRWALPIALAAAGLGLGTLAWSMIFIVAGS